MESLEWLRKRLTGFGAEKKIAAVKRFAAVAENLGVQLPALAIAWCLKNPQVSTVILGASKVSQLKVNFAALTVLERMSPQVMAELDQISRTVAE